MTLFQSSPPAVQAVITQALQRVGLALEGNVEIGTPFRIGAIIDLILAKKSKEIRGQDKYRVSSYILNTLQSTLDKNGDTIKLTDKERDVLVLLSEANGKTVTRQVLMDQIWGYAEGVETHTIETHIYRLRQKIEDDPANPKILMTGVDGYYIPI